MLEADELESLIEAAGDLTGRVGATDINERFQGSEIPRRRRAALEGDRQGCLGSPSRPRSIATSAPHAAADRRCRPRTARLSLRSAALACASQRQPSSTSSDIDLAHRKIRVKDAKTDAGIRRSTSPRLAAELRAYLATRAGDPPTAPAFPTRTGRRRDKDNIRNRVVAPALNEPRAPPRRELPPIDTHVTPHTLRRTYISIMLSAGADVPYVQAQVGHKDPKLTLRIYALMLQRRDRRQFGAAFDQLMREAIPSMQHANMHGQRPLTKAA